MTQSNYDSNGQIDALRISAEALKQRAALRLKLLAKQHDIPDYLCKPAKEVDVLLKQTVIQKENHSVVLIGPRNSYKTTAIQKTLSFLYKEHARDFIVIHLNGMLHSEQHAIKSIAKQMEEQLKRLDSLRQPHDRSRARKKASINMTDGSLSEIFQRFLQVLDYSDIDYSNASEIALFDEMIKETNEASSKKEKISIIFLFDEIDLFAGPVRQTLLYNLFDMVENSPISFCIIGLTTKLNLLEFFEKRVKSRFSNRTISFMKPKSYDDFQKSFSKILMIKEPQNDVEKSWNNDVLSASNDPDSHYNRLVRRNYDTVKDLKLLWNGFLQVFSKRNFNHPQEDGTLYSLSKNGLDLVTTYEKHRFASTWSGRLNTLSDLEMLIIIATTRIALKDSDNVTFSKVYNEYSSLISMMNKSIPSMASAEIKDIDGTYKLWSKTNVKNVWESLIRLGFLIERGTLGLRDSAFQAFVTTNYQTIQQMVPFDLRIYNSVLTLHELRQYLPSSSSLYQWTQI
ncbi:hypothetical protein ACO0RG_000034 [Hanseniaspora osmophila]